MKDLVLKVVLALMVGLLLSCGSAASSGTYRPISNIPNAEVIGSVQTMFTMDAYGGIVTESVKQQAYIKLKEVAAQRYQGNIDIVNITVSLIRGGTLSRGGYPADFSADGQVVSLGGGSGRSAATGVEGALARAAEAVSENFTARSRIAIVYITAQDRSTTDYITGELEHILRQQGFVIIDRSELDRVRAEQRLGASLEVDDNTAARIGRISGASIVITGRVDGEGNLRRLRLRALDTTSAQVVGTASERL